MKIAFRVDGGKSIGMGHIMRCLSLANEFRKKGVEVYFISKYYEGIEKIEENKFYTVKLPCDDIDSSKIFDYGDNQTLDEEALKIVEILKKYDISTLIVDSYNVSEKYLLKLKENLKILTYIDDINSFSYPVDILVNGNSFAIDVEYKKYFESEKLLLGSKYNLIRSEFKNLPKRKISKEVRSIMITTGGSDPDGVLIKTVREILKDDYFNNISLNLVVGSGFSNKEEIYLLGEENKYIRIYENPSSISEIMLNSDIAISSGGSTLYELCSCGTPTLAFIYADNQLPLVEKLSNSGYVVDMGWYNDDLNLLYNLKGLMKDFSKRIEMSVKGQELVDGNGASRVADAIIESMRGV